MVNYVPPLVACITENKLRIRSIISGSSRNNLKMICVLSSSISVDRISGVLSMSHSAPMVFRLGFTVNRYGFSFSESYSKTYFHICAKVGSAMEWDVYFAI